MLRASVPATSANLGPGFDTLGLAIDLYLEVTVEKAAADDFAYSGTGSNAGSPGAVPTAAGNLVHAGFKAVFAQVGEEPPTVRMTVRNPIPLARGLGSSSAALVAGAALADAWLGAPLGRDGVFHLTAGLEGHPDNVGPAVYGGFTVAAAGEDGRFTAATLTVPDSWSLLFGVPAFELPTVAARAALPTSYAVGDAVLTSSRAALWVAAVALDAPELLRTASRDVLHQPHRAPLVPGMQRGLDDLWAAGAYAAFLSGAGPTLGAVVAPHALSASRAALQAFVGPSGHVLAPRAASGYVVERW
jgi:homoserine kinase